MNPNLNDLIEFCVLRAEESGLATNEREILYRFCDQYVNDLLPHLFKCFERVCPQSSIANKLCVSLIELNKLSNAFPNLNIERVADPVVRLLPPKNDNYAATQELVGFMPSDDDSNLNESILNDSKRFKSETD